MSGDFIGPAFELKHFVLIQKLCKQKHSTLETSREGLAGFLDTATPLQSPDAGPRSSQGTASSLSSTDSSSLVLAPPHKAVLLNLWVPTLLGVGCPFTGAA